MTEVSPVTGATVQPDLPAPGGPPAQAGAPGAEDVDAVEVTEAEIAIPLTLRQ